RIRDNDDDARCSAKSVIHSIVSLVEHAEGAFAAAANAASRLEVVSDVQVDCASCRPLRAGFDAEVDVVLNVASSANGGVAFAVGDNINIIEAGCAAQAAKKRRA